MIDDLEDAGGAVTAGLVAREIDRAKAGAPAVGHAEDEPCANCGVARIGPYCHRCGQAGHVHRTAGALVHDIAHGVFHFEGRTLRTLPLLAWRPGELTRRYVAGERAKFVSPMALFLFSVFLMFALVSGIDGEIAALPSQAIANTRAAIDAERSRQAAAIATLEAERARTTDVTAIARLDRALVPARARLAALPSAGGATGLGDLNLELGNERLEQAVRHAVRNPELTLYKMKSYGYKYSWTLIPFSLPFIWLLFAFRRDVGLYDHAVFAIYSLAFMSLGVCVMSLLAKVHVPGGALVMAALVVPPWHMYRQLKGAYGLSRFGAAWRTAALLASVIVVGGLFLTLIVYLGTG